MGAERVRVVIVDDQRLFAEALEAILSTDGRISVVGRAENGHTALELAREPVHPLSHGDKLERDPLVELSAAAKNENEEHESDDERDHVPACLIPGRRGS